MTEEVPKPLMYAEESGESDFISFIHTHPSRNILAVGGTSGHVNMYGYTPGEDCHKEKSFALTSGYSCRVLNFTSDGKKLFLGSERGELSLVEVETGTIVHSFIGHKAPPYCMLHVGLNIVATGDDEGFIKLWDMRSMDLAVAWRPTRAFVSDLAVGKDRKSLLATSGDGRLFIMDQRNRKDVQRSDANESELLSVGLVKGGDKVVCGNGEGALMIYNWGLWSDITDRYPIYSQSMDCLLPITDSVICTGCMDGWVRSVQILPNQLLGLVGQHEGQFPVEHMCTSQNRDYLVTSSQDSCHFWRMSQIPTLPAQDSEEEEGAVRKKKKRKKRKRRHLETEKLAKKKSQSEGFFADL